MIARVAPLLVCTGCHLLFELEEIEPPPPVDAGDGATPPCTIPYFSPGDFDGDGIENSVDSCPLVSGAMPDGDGDGVGVNCDPHPTLPGDCILIMQDFREPTLPCWTTNNWRYDTTGWSSPSPSNRETLLCSPLASISYGIMIGKVLEASSDPLRAVLVMYRYGDAVDLTGDVCGLRQQLGNFAVTSGLWKNDFLTSGSSTQTSPSVGFQPASIQLDRWTAGATAALCTLQVTANGTMGGATTDAFGNVSGRLAIHSIATPFRVEAFIGYGIGTACAR